MSLALAGRACAIISLSLVLAAGCATDVAIQKPPPAMPPEWAAYLGTWAGKWDEVWDAEFTVWRIAGDGTASIRYRWKEYVPGSFSIQDLTGSFRDRRLVSVSGGITLEADPDGPLHMLAIIRSRNVRAALLRKVIQDGDPRGVTPVAGISGGYFGVQTFTGGGTGATPLRASLAQEGAGVTGFYANNQGDAGRIHGSMSSSGSSFSGHLESRIVARTCTVEGKSERDGANLAGRSRVLAA